MIKSIQITGVGSKSLAFISKVRSSECVELVKEQGKVFRFEITSAAELSTGVTEILFKLIPDNGMAEIIDEPPPELNIT